VAPPIRTASWLLTGPPWLSKKFRPNSEKRDWKRDAPWLGPPLEKLSLPLLEVKNLKLIFLSWLCTLLPFGYSLLPSILYFFSLFEFVFLCLVCYFGKLFFFFFWWILTNTVLQNTNVIFIQLLGLNVNSFEVWNPRDNSIQTMAETVPPSIGSAYGLPSPQMFSLKEGKEILAFFGFPDVKASYGGVWRYLVDSNTWTSEATLAHGKFRHLAFPVEGLSCWELDPLKMFVLCCWCRRNKMMSLILVSRCVFYLIIIFTT